MKSKPLPLTAEGLNPPYYQPLIERELKPGACLTNEKEAD